MNERELYKLEKISRYSQNPAVTMRVHKDKPGANSNVFKLVRTGANKKCPCGSGRKYKMCHRRAIFN